MKHIVVQADRIHSIQWVKKIRFSECAGIINITLNLNEFENKKLGKYKLPLSCREEVV